MASSILVDQKDGILTISLNRPEVRNALNAAIRSEMGDLLDTVNGDASVRAVVITGVGDRAFCGGQDLGEAKDFSVEEAVLWVDDLYKYYQSIRYIEKPVVSAVNGVAAGAGIQIALLSDMRIGHSGTRMGQPELNAGLASVIGAQLLTLSIGHARSVDLALTGRLMDGDEAYRVGLLNELVAAEHVLPRAIEVATMLASKPVTAMRLTKQRYRDETDAAFEAAIEAGRQLQRIAYESGEPQKIMGAFANRKKR